MKPTAEHGQWHLEASARDGSVRAACGRFFSDAAPFEYREGNAIPEWARCPRCRLLDPIPLRA